MLVVRQLPVLSIAALLVACTAGGGGGGAGGGPDAGPGEPDARIYEPPRDDLVPAVGGDDTIDLATWNIENFPATPQTARLVADLIASMELDLIAVEEIASIEAFDEVVARLPDHEGVLSSHTYGDGNYQKVGFIYKPALIEVEGGALLFTSQGFDFPRPPLQIQATVDGKTFSAIALHLKAGQQTEDRDRRAAAITTLAGHLGTFVDAGGHAIALGDFNQTRVTATDDQVWAAIVDAPERFTVLTEAAADSGEESFAYTGRMIDHAVATAGFVLGAPTVTVVHLEDEPLDYTDIISDHLPVVVSFPR